jgi:hypothetical protein
MTQTLVSQPVAPSEFQNPDLPAEPIVLAREDIQESASTTAMVPTAMLEAVDDRYYANHWGINE